MARASQQHVEDWIASNGGPQALQYGTEQKPVRNPEFDPVTNPFAPQYTTIEVEVWKNPATGAILTAQRQGDGNFDIIENVGPKPQSAGNGPKEGDVRGPQTGPTREVFEGGTWVVRPNPIYQAPGAEKEIKPVPNRPGYYTVTTSKNGVTETHYEDVEGRRVQLPPEKPDGATQIVQRNGRSYWVKPSKMPGGLPEVYGPDGKLVPAGLPDEQKEPDKPVIREDPDNPGQFIEITRENGRTVIRPVTREGATTRPTRAGPALPQMILGHSQAALTQYGNDLQAAMARGELTPAQVATRWEQAKEAAQLAINEATLIQNQNQSDMNASINLANSRLSASTSGFNTALQVVNSLNDKLPKGSRLGGEGFAALLGIQIAHAQRMGAYDNIVPGSQGSVTGRSVSAAVPAVTGATQTAIGNVLNQPPAPPNAIGLGAIGNQPAPAAPGPLTPSVPPAVPMTPDRVQGHMDNPAFRPMPEAIPLPGGSADPTTWQPAQPYNDDPSKGPVGQAAPDFAVLSNLQPPAPLSPPSVPEPMQAPMPMALMQNEAASRVPWHMDDAEIEHYRSMGIPDDVIFGVPGVAA